MANERQAQLNGALAGLLAQVLAPVLAQVLAGQGLNAVALPAAAPKAPRQPRAKKAKAAPAARVISKDLAVAAGTALLAAGVPGSAAVFGCKYQNRRGYFSEKTFKVLESWTNAEGEPGVRVALCDAAGKALGAEDSVGDGSRKLILGAIAELKKLA